MKVLVLCHGNICRSPLAATFFKKHLGDDNVRQGGFSSTMNRSSPPRIRRAAWRWNNTGGLDDHKSRRVTREDVDWADRVFVMGPGNMKRFNAEFPDATAELLGSHHDPKLRAIKDLNFIREDDPLFEIVVRQIHDCVSNICEG